MTIDYKKTQFLLSVASIKQLPPDVGYEIAIVGRSNAGKSSVLNQLTQNKKLARTSKTPGRTQHLNFFQVDNVHRIVDLPGYGYAKVPVAEKERWQGLIDDYLRNRKSLVGLVLVMDSRHPLQPFDLKMLEWSQQCELPIHILLNKADKLSNNQMNRTLQQVTKTITAHYPYASCQLFTALSGQGLPAFKEVLNTWLNP